MHGGSTAVRRADRCRECFRLALAEDLDRRAPLLERLWANGLKQREIAEVLSRPAGTIAAEIRRLRSRGYHFPFRYRVVTPLAAEVESLLDKRW